MKKQPNQIVLEGRDPAQLIAIADLMEKNSNESVVWDLRYRYTNYARKYTITIKVRTWKT